MHITILLAHPNPGSFNHAIAATAADALRNLGHSVIVHDLHQEGFDPLLPAAELGRDPVLPPDVMLHCEEIARADGIIVVHPNWWGTPPAVLKGWVDRVLRPEVAYRFVAGDNGEGVPVGLLPAKAAMVFNTANTPPERELAVFGDPLEGFWRKCVFEFCGVRNFHRRTFSVVITSTLAQRQAWLEEVRSIVTAQFPA